MFLAVVFCLLPSIIFYLIYIKDSLLKSSILKISLSWFLGQYISTLIIYVLSLLLSLFTFSILFKASIFLLGFYVLVSIILFPKLFQLFQQTRIIFTLGNLLKIGLIAILLVFSFYLFKIHLSQNNGVIYTSPVFWDFKVHVSIIQNFVFGDNFPPENVSFSGISMTYHFFFDLLIAIYSSLGLDLAGSVNFVSTTSFFFMLLAIIGLSEELFNSIIIGAITILLTITSSSLRFINYFISAWDGNLIKTITQILRNSQHPFSFSFIEGNPFGYNGTMFNIFYFIEERQMIFAVLFLIFALVVFLYINHLSYQQCLIAGILLGLFLQWHLFATINICFIPIILFTFTKERQKIFTLFIGFSIVFIWQILYFKLLTQSVWFLPDITNYPKLNFNFPTMSNEYPFTILNALGYYIFNYGMKVILIYLGFNNLFKNNKQCFLLMISLVLPAFILTNTIQLSPVSVYDNHKWLRPMNVILDILVAYTLIEFFINNKMILKKLIGITLFILMTLSGFIELMPFLNSRPTTYYVNYQSPIIKEIRQHTPPKTVFLSNNQSVFLAGRRVFLWIVPGQNLGLNYDLRIKIINKIYNADDLYTLCNIIKQFGIDYIEFNSKTIELPIFAQIPTSNLQNIIDKTNNITFVNMKNTCQSFLSKI